MDDKLQTLAKICCAVAYQAAAGRTSATLEAFALSFALYGRREAKDIPMPAVWMLGACLAQPAVKAIFDDPPEEDTLAADAKITEALKTFSIDEIVEDYLPHDVVH